MAMSWLYTFSTQVDEPPTGNQVRFNGVNPATVTRIWIRSQTTDGIDAQRLLLAQPIGTLMYVQDKNDHTLAVAFVLAAAPVDKSTYVEWPVTFDTTTGAPLLNNQAILVLALEAAAGPGPTPPTPLPPLVTLADAKMQLRITTPDDDPGDPAVQQQLDAAQALVVDYCNATAWWRAVTATWTPATVPDVVKAAILLQCAEFYRFRGDDVEGQGPARVEGADLAPRVAELLRRSRDPVVA